MMTLLNFWQNLFSSGSKQEKKKPSAKKSFKSSRPGKGKKIKKIIKKRPAKSVSKAKKKRVKSPPKKPLRKKSLKKKLPKPPARKKTVKVKPLKSEGKTKKKLIKKPAKRLSAPKREAGVITHYFGKISVGIIKLKSELKVGDKINISGKGYDFQQAVTSIQIERKSVPSASRGEEIGIKVVRKVHENDKVYLL